MDLVAKLQVHIVCFAVLMIIYKQFRKEAQAHSLQDQLFKYLTLSTIFLLVLEASSKLINGQNGQVMRTTHVILNTLLFMANTLPLIIWTLYILTTISDNKKHLIKGFIPMGIIASINILIALSTPFTGKYFYIDPSNIYHRGEWYIVSGMIVNGALFLYNVVIIASNWRKINQKNRSPVLYFLLPPIIGLLAQTLCFGVNLIWAGTTISVLIVYITIQSQIVQTDYLTGLYNRRYLDNYLARKMHNLPDNKQFAGIIIDIDDFKSINDKYGHAVGDMALRQTSSLLKKVFYKGEFVARYGGDEFVVILDISNKAQLQEQVAELDQQFNLFNQKNKSDYKLKISIGYDVYKATDKMDGELLNRLDKLMYKHKNSKKLSEKE